MLNCTAVASGETDLFGSNVNWFLIPAVLIISLLSLLEKRNKYWITKCNGRPGLVSPMNFIDGYKNRWGLSFVLGALVSLMLALTRRVLVNVDYPVWAKIFLVYLQCISSSVITFPLFACMTSRHRLVGSLIGLLYSGSWLAFLLYVIVENALCGERKLEGSGFDTVTYLVMHGFLELLCSMLLVGKFTVKLGKCLLKHKFAKDENYDEFVKRHREYVKQFFTAKCLKETRTRTMSMKDRLLYYFRKPVPGFTYPTHVFCTTFGTIAILYSVLVECLEIGQKCSEWFFVIIGNDDVADFVTGANVTAIVLSTVVGIYNIYCSVTAYKQDLLRLYKGDKTFIPMAVLRSSPENHMVRRTKYMGTMIICMAYGMFVCYFFLFIPLASLLIIFRELTLRGKSLDMLEQLQWLIYPMSVVLIAKLQAILTRRFLLQHKVEEKDKTRPLAIKNRMAFQLFSFFNIFISVSIGIFSVLKRLLVAFLFGIFLVPRMDRVLCMNGYEDYDKVYMMYVGLLLVDHTHNNPILRVFCSILNEQKSVENGLDSTVENPIYAVFDQRVIRRGKSRGSSRAKNRWLLAYTLLHNRSLSGLRKHQLPGIVLQMEQESVENKHLIDKVHSKIPANIGTNFATFFILMIFVFFYLGYSALFSPGT